MHSPSPEIARFQHALQIPRGDPYLIQRATTYKVLRMMLESNVPLAKQFSEQCACQALHASQGKVLNVLEYPLLAQPVANLGEFCYFHALGGIAVQEEVDWCHEVVEVARDGGKRLLLLPRQGLRA